MGLRLLLILLLASLFSPDSNTLTELAGIAHVAFRVKDVAKSRDFYQKLGFEQSFEFNDPGKAPVSYMKVNDRQFIELYQRNDDSQPLGLMHVCYEASDIEALQKEYVSREVKAPEPKKARAGNMLFTIRDPENQVIEFTEYMPGSLHFEDRGRHLGEAHGAIHMESVVFGVQDVPTERGFYTTKLGFKDSGSQGVLTLRLPGNSLEEIGLQSASPTPKPRIVFSVASLQRTANDLHKRGLFPDQRFSVTDPDGVVVVFVEKKEQTNKNR